MKSKATMIAMVIAGIAFAAAGGFYFSQRDMRSISITSESPDQEGEKEPEATDAVAAYEWRMLAWRDENGDIPENALANAIEERDAYLAQFGDSDGFGELPISNLPWLSRGPTNVGGRTRPAAAMSIISSEWTAICRLRPIMMVTA